MTAAVAAAPVAQAFSLDSLDDNTIAGSHTTQDVVVDLTADDNDDAPLPPGREASGLLFTLD